MSILTMMMVMTMRQKEHECDDDYEDYEDDEYDSFLEENQE